MFFKLLSQFSSGLPIQLTDSKGIINTNREQITSYELCATMKKWGTSFTSCVGMIRSNAQLGWKMFILTTASDLQGIKTSEGIANRLTLLKEDGSLIKRLFKVIKSTKPSQGIASAVRPNDPGFIDGGRTACFVAEFVLLNLQQREMVRSSND